MQDVKCVQNAYSYRSKMRTKCVLKCLLIFRQTYTFVKTQIYKDKMNDFVKKVGLTLILVFVPLMQVQAQDNVVIGNGVILSPLPTPPITNPPIIGEGDEDGEGGDGEDGEEENKGRTLSNANFYLSIDNHTLYLYPDGIHDRMTLWVCDVDNHIIVHEVFVMNGERQALSLSPALSGEYYVYIKVGDYYYMGNIWL